MTTKPAIAHFQASDNVARMQASSTLAAMQAAEALRAAGADVVDFGAGEPDFDTPDNIKRAAEEAMWAGKTKYTSTGGTRALQQAIIDFYAGTFGANYERNEVMSTSGGKQAIFNAVVSLINPGDEVLMAKPYWVTFPEVVIFAGGIPVFIETEETGFVLSAEQVARAITPRTKLIILNSPCNPSGRVIPPAEFQRIMELLAERDIYVITDECYLRFVYPPAEVFSVASLPAELRARLCIAGSFSKTYAMTGWRVGYALASREWTREMLKVQGHSTSNVNSIAQSAAVEALTGSQESVATMLAEYTARRAWLLSALRTIPRLSCNEPEGAFYAFPSVRGCLGGEVKTSAEFSARLLTEEQTVVTDGAAFGAEGYLRISYATSREQLEEGVTRIRRFVERLSA
ncbi:MAG TPA: pyridoxal phosphate-dependent aminotransferase [Pyrinomonadaceae bacterium]|jgi:aspartate aminotransferase|nr:pyridoxal phosphate-dependent aminotransferase [Pyrinomonadaceae bacterium]